MPPRFFTIGHSNRGIEEFSEILRDAGVGLLVDVRSFPRSRSNPDYNIDVLPERLAHYQIGYRQMPELGGRRTRQPGIDDAVNGAWRNRSFHNYADYALSAVFGDALCTLVGLGRTTDLAMMCAEAVWWRCHRRIVADYLLLNGHAVCHLMGHGREEPAKPTRGAIRRGDGKVVYPADGLEDPARGH
jgi:uncharacterized protein (DUF488 family)